jgi:hypothetical protein
VRTGVKVIGGGLVLALVAGACSDDDTAEAPSVEEARVAFCDASSEYVAALDRYGRLFEDNGVTVGDVRTDAEALTAGRAGATRSSSTGSLESIGESRRDRRARSAGCASRMFLSRCSPTDVAGAHEAGSWQLGHQ